MVAVLKAKLCEYARAIQKHVRALEQDITVITQDLKQRLDIGHVGNGNMRLDELGDDITEARMVWRKSGNKIKRGVRCTSGRRKGRVVSTATQCAAPIDMTKRMTLKKTKAKFGKRLARKARRTKRVNPISKRLKSLNPRRR